MRFSRLVLATAVLLFMAETPSKSGIVTSGDAISVPYRLTATKHILVRVKINDQGPFNLILDTGAPVVVMSQKIARKLNVRTDSGHWADIKRFEIEGGITLNNVVCRFDDLFQLEGMNGFTMAGVEIHGMIGYPILARYRIEYDLTKKHLTWTPVAVPIQELPRNPGRSMETGGLNSLGNIMKGLGRFLGADQVPKATPRGFVGLTLSANNENLKVSHILSGGPADISGVLLNDIIVKANQKKIVSINEFAQVIKPLTAGTKLPLTILRGNAELDLTIELGGGF